MSPNLEHMRLDSPGDTPKDCRNIMVLRMPTFSAKDSPIRRARLGPMPGISVRRSGWASIISRVAFPKCFTMSLAVAGPTPLTRPADRYFSMSETFSGSRDS